MTIDAQKFHSIHLTVDEFVSIACLEFTKLNTLLSLNSLSIDITENVFDWVISANLTKLKTIVSSKFNKPSGHDLDIINRLSKELSNKNPNHVLIKEILELYKNRII